MHIQSISQSSERASSKTAAKDKQNGYSMRLAKALAEGLWEEEEEAPKEKEPESKKKRARSS